MNPVIPMFMKQIQLKGTGPRPVKRKAETITSYSPLKRSDTPAVQSNSSHTIVHQEIKGGIEVFSMEQKSTMSQSQGSCQEDPEFITYLLSPEVKHDSYFLVGENKIERIGAVRKMLVAHSVVFRAELQDSEIAEKGEVIVKDLLPKTFRNLLKFIYGYNNISSLTFEEADDLLYAANKYFMEELKKQLALRLIALLNSQNICSLLNNPACDSVLELDTKIIQIIQFETNDVLASPQFLHVRPEGFIKILEQNLLNITEIELFKNALIWTKNKVQCEERNQLRKQFEELKHIRIRTISLQDFLRVVVPSGILTSDEVMEFCIFYGKDKKPPAIDGFSSNTDQRFDSKYLELQIPKYTTEQVNSVSLEINTKCTVGLLPLEIQAYNLSSQRYRCVCTVIINNESNKEAPSVTVKFDELVTSGQIFKIPLENNGIFFTLLPNTSYKININFEVPYTMVVASTSSVSNNELCLRTLKHSYNYDGPYGIFPFSSLKYIKLFPTM